MHMKSNAKINSNVIKTNHNQLMLQVDDTLRSLHDTCSQSAMTSARIRDYQNESMSQLSVQYVDNDNDSHQEECKSHMFDDLDSSDCESARSMPVQGSYTPKYDSARVAALIERSNQAMAGCELTIEKVNNTQRRLPTPRDTLGPNDARQRPTIPGPGASRIPDTCLKFYRFKLVVSSL